MTLWFYDPGGLLLHLGGCFYLYFMHIFLSNVS